MISIPLIEDIEISFIRLLKEVESNPEMNEETLRSKFYREGILERLGYSDKEILGMERMK